MKKLFWLFSVLVMLVITSSSFGEAVPTLVGDFESAAVGGRYDDWWDDGLTIVSVTSPASAITLNTHALKGTTTVGGWGPGVQFNLNSRANAVDTATAPEGCLVADYTAFAADFSAGWCQIGLTRNTAATTGGWDKSYWQDMILDGEAHRVIFVLDDITKEKILDGLDSWGSNLGFCLNTGEASTATVYFDNVWLLPTLPQDELLPHDPEVEQIEDEINLDIDTTFRWKAAADPNEDRGLPVDPNIVDQYVFINDGLGGTDLFYLGNTGEDPGTEPNSVYGPVNLEYNRIYYWAVVEAMVGHTQSLTQGVSTLADVDPNNLIGPTWHYNSVSTLPEITDQPDNVRVAIGTQDFEAFHIVADSLTPVIYQWYNSTDDVIDAGDFALTSASATTDTLILGASPGSIGTGHQKYYYCRVANASTVSGGGTYDDVYSNVVSLVVERMVAQYQFESNLNDTNPVTTDRHNGTGVNGPTFSTDSVEGTYSLSLDGVNQYVTLGDTAYPKASLPSSGIGGGLDMGSILCWVKATQAGGILTNADPNTRAAFQVEGDGYGAIIVRGGTTQVGYQYTQASPYYNLVNDGNWHLLAATWDMNGNMNMYVDTARVQAGANDTTFKPWLYSVLIGAARSNTANYTEVGNFFGGLLDNLRVYNYVVTPEAVAQEYYDVTGTKTCVYPDFTGNNANLDNTGSSFCQVDLADFAVMAQNWLTDGFYPL